jgi:leucyl aminopeptidase
MEIIRMSGSDNHQAYKVVLVDNNTEGVDASILNELSKDGVKMVEEKGVGNHTFYVSLPQESEELRVRGSEVRDRLNKEAKELAVTGPADAAFDLLEGFLLASYQFIKYFKDRSKRAYTMEKVYVQDGFTDEQIAELNNIKQAVYWSRDLINEPVSYLNAERLAQEVVERGSQVGISVKVLEKTQIESLKMGGLLAVNKGSIDPPTFTIAEYKPENPINKKPIVLVGKGVVYDTGGLSLKPTPNSMDTMKSDMGGAACVAGAIYLAALEKLPVHIVALIPATDNRPGLNAYAPGDVITMYDGTTVEVLNTDAEGRMILADALAYSKKFDPELVIDAATLTGAAYRAIGEHATIIMGNADERYFADLEKAGEESFERVVKFPFWKEYLEPMKSQIADLKNIGGPTAGMITAGKFLEHFVAAPYIHMDIAGPAWLDKKSAYRTAGGPGTGVRLLYHFFKNMVNE